MCPIKKFKVPEAKEPWITNEAIEAIRDKDNLLKRARKSKLQEDWEAARQAHNNVGRQVENLRIDYLKNQQVAHKSDPKNFWNTISSIIPSKKQSSKLINLKESEHLPCVEQDKTAQFMNLYFSSIGPT